MSGRRRLEAGAPRGCAPRAEAGSASLRVDAHSNATNYLESGKMDAVEEDEGFC